MTVHCVEDVNLSIAWTRAFAVTAAEGEIRPLVVSVTEFQDGKPRELSEIRRLLDRELGDRKKQGVATVANTMFPTSMWNPAMPRQHLYDRYRTVLPRLRQHRANRYGLYFERLIAFGENRVNQLEHVITTWNDKNNHRRSALIASIVDPNIDHTHQPVRGFPCLQQVSFAPEGKRGLSVIGFYAMQYIFERAYGNYLGLCHIGNFVASQIGRQLSRMTCVSGVAKRDIRKDDTGAILHRMDEVLARA